jgi:pimeloyl-ACP methyl ester carboxylesterase
VRYFVSVRPFAPTVGFTACILALGLTACRSPYLPDERRIPPYAALTARAEAAQRLERVRVVPPQGKPLEVALRVSRAPTGEAHPTFVFLNGSFADGTTWRFVVGALADEFHLVAVDPPGTGASDKPDPRSAAPRTAAPLAYTPTWTAEHVLLALEAHERLLAARPRYVLVGHSLGGTAVLRMLADPDLGARHRDLLARVGGAVLIAPVDVAMETVDPRVEEVTGLTDLEASLGTVLGIVRSRVNETIHDSVLVPRRDALRQEADRIACMMIHADTRHAAQAMLLRFSPVDRCGRRDLEAARRLADQERSIRVPVLILWGLHDDALPVAQSGPLLKRLGAVAGLEVVAGAKHSVQQEQVLLVAERLRAFARDPLAAVAAAPTHAGG